MAEAHNDVAAEVVEAIAEEEVRVCLFSMGEDTYAIPVEVLTEIIIPQTIFPVPSTPPHVLGVINLRGNIVPIVDIRPILSLPADHTAVQVAILRLHHLLLGAVVDSVTEVASIPVSKFLDVPSEHALQHPSGKIRNRYLRSIIQRERGVAALLDIEKLFNAIKLA